MKNEYLENFNLDWDINPNSTGIIELNILKEDKDLEYVCFVEGTSDITFYKNYSNSPLKNKNVEFIRMKTTKETDQGDEIGKDGIIKNYLNITNNITLKKYLSKCIFLVDNDYEGLVSSNYELMEFEKDFFSITKTYSFENYFFKKENLKKIFGYFNLSEADLKKFNCLIEQFIKDVDEYNRLKSSILIACKKGRYNTKLPKSTYYTPDEIFHFDFKGKYNYYFNIFKMNEQKKAMRSAINYSSLIKEYYMKESVKFSGTTDFIRGHDLYKLITVYFNQIFNKNIYPKSENEDYINVIKLLSIDIDIKNGNGNMII